MQITRLYLRNYRVFETELDLPVPAGLVGVYGPNGAGKSSLLESILWTLWGRSRTRTDEIRSAGTNGDCTTEVEFEHEGHLYQVRRVITGINCTVKASAFADGLQVASGARDVKQYVHSILGMDDAAFRASVFAEQKQLASFSGQRPAERRDLVLRLLGITPLDAARDAARKDARGAADDVERVRSLLPDLDVVRPAAELAAATADRLAADADSEAVAAATARQLLETAEGAAGRLEELRHEHEALVREGRAAKAAIDQAAERMARLESELAELADAEATLEALRAAAAGLDEAEAELRLVAAVDDASAALARLPHPAPGAAAEPPDPAAAEAARARADATRGQLDTVTGEITGARAELERARQELSRSVALSAAEDCPMCGQELGTAFERVQAHRRAEVAEAERRVAELAERRQALVAETEAAAAGWQALARELAGRRAAWEEAEQLRHRRAAAEQARAEAVAALGREPAGGEGLALSTLVAAAREAARSCARLEGRLVRKPEARRELAEVGQLRSEAADRRLNLLEKVKALGFDAEALAAARTARDDARRRHEVAGRVADEARVGAERARVKAEAEAERLADAERQHAGLAEKVEEARHLDRLAKLLNAFRTSVVAAVGPQLSAQAAELFGELTDNEYDLLRVDPETYEIQIVDQGREFGMDRFSGSETDLANLALRVAISEHLRFQSGGAVGLLVLDEIFGPLDDDRRERMLLALERLRGRFRQVLVVTHATEIKDQLPAAIEVVKLSGRRATARVMGV